MTATVLAAFDVDKTLTTRDCVLPFLRRCAPLPVTLGRLLTQGASATGAVLQRNRDQLKQIGTRAALAGRYVQEVERLGLDYAGHISEHWLRSDTVDRLQWHKSCGHKVVLVSASYEIYLQPLSRLLGVDTVLATRLAVEGTRFTGELEGANCRGPEKIRRLLEWMSRDIGDRSAVELWAYGDSAGDRAMLEAADHPVWVGKHLVTPTPRRDG